MAHYFYSSIPENAIIEKHDDPEEICNILYFDIKLPKDLAKLISSYFKEPKYFITTTTVHGTIKRQYIYDIPYVIDIKTFKWVPFGTEKCFIRDTRYYRKILQEVKTMIYLD